MPFKFPSGWGSYLGAGVILGICFSFVMGELLPWAQFNLGGNRSWGMLLFLAIGVIWTILISYQPEAE